MVESHRSLHSMGCAMARYAEPPSKAKKMTKETQDAMSWTALTSFFFFFKDFIGSEQSHPFK